ncbi:hypothetical protein EVAR_64868_1 [Eumeta japonica]|uniref:Uncharacterized protein n=1 Tax=Eumeta variegata TaxID=151549 RepID=A0A4C1ZLV8_EUMVA|nr:hypothetical protein EVAR_64868_1 [Eumeta japonica]
MGFSSFSLLLLLNGVRPWATYNRSWPATFTITKSSVRLVEGRFMQRRPVRGRYSRIFLLQRLSVLRAMWSARCHFQSQIPGDGSAVKYSCSVFTQIMDLMANDFNNVTARWCRQAHSKLKYRARPKASLELLNTVIQTDCLTCCPRHRACAIIASSYNRSIRPWSRSNPEPPGSNSTTEPPPLPSFSE